jgi:hypothetical protein
MIDIQGELLQIKQLRDQKYISITELLDFIKKYNPNSSFQDIATYLLIKLAPNDIRKADEDIWGDEQYDFWQEQNGIAVFNIPKSIDEKETYIHPNFFFEALETVRDNPEGVSFHEGWEFAEEARIYLKKGQQDIYIDRARIEKLLSIDTLTQHEQYKPTQINNTHNGSAEINKINARITELENTHIDTEKDSIIAQLQSQNAELKAQLQDNEQRQSAVNYDDFSIYGHKSELLEILFKVTEEFWADSETPPKNSVIEQWIETNYPVKDYPYVSKAVRQYIATILRPQPKLK